MLSGPELSVVGGMVGMAAVFLFVRLFFKKEAAIVIDKPDGALGAQYHPESVPMRILMVLIVLAWLVWESWTLYLGYDIDFKAFYVAGGLLLIAQLALAMADRPRKGTIRSESYRTAVIIPVYNENPDSLKSCLESLFRQTCMPAEIHVVDDSSTKVKYTKIKKWFLKEAGHHGIDASWLVHAENKGKRDAHVTALDVVKRQPHTIVVTIDSDGTLDAHALEQGLLPFADPVVQSVAGVVLTKNIKESLVSRLMDMFFVSQQLVDRAAMSRLGSVLVNSGCLAFYRLPVIEAALKHGYANEVFLGRKMSMSDDSYLTLFALLHGKTVQQPSAIVFADMPETFDHHFRQQIRWLRGSFVRSMWRLKFLPLNSWGYVRQVLSWLSWIASTLVIVQLLVLMPLLQDKNPPLILLVVPVIVGYIQSIRYFVIQRSDVTLAYQLASYAMAPLVALWSMFVLRALRIYAALTCYRTGWGTRSIIEIPTRVSTDNG